MLWNTGKSLTIKLRTMCLFRAALVQSKVKEVLKHYTRDISNALWFFFLGGQRQLKWIAKTDTTFWIMRGFFHRWRHNEWVRWAVQGE
jgi:hypothetical protein